MYDRPVNFGEFFCLYLRLPIGALGCRHSHYVCLFMCLEDSNLGLHTYTASTFAHGAIPALGAGNDKGVQLFTLQSGCSPLPHTWAVALNNSHTVPLPPVGGGNMLLLILTHRQDPAKVSLQEKNGLGRERKKLVQHKSYLMLGIFSKIHMAQE